MCVLYHGTMEDKDENENVVTDCFSCAVVNWTLDYYPNGSNETPVEIEWDNWDEFLWTSEQRRLLEQGDLPRQVQFSLGVLLALVVFFAFIANSTILYVFSR